MKQEELDALFRKYMMKLADLRQVDEALRLGLLRKLLYDDGLPASLELHVATAIVALGPTNAGPPPVAVFEAVNEHIPVDALLLYRRRVEDLRRSKAEIERRLENIGWLCQQFEQIPQSWYEPVPSSQAEAAARANTLLWDRLLEVLTRFVSEEVKPKEIGLLEEQRREIDERNPLSGALPHVIKNPLSSLQELLALGRRALEQRLKECKNDLNQISNDDPAVSVAVWFGQGGNVRPFKTGWLDGWSLTALWLKNRVHEVCLFADNLLVRRWGLADRSQLDMSRGREQGTALLAPKAPEDILMRLVKRDSTVWDLDRQRPLHFVFRQMPVADLEIDAHLEDAAYQEQWAEAGATVSLGDDIPIAPLRPETRFVFRTTAEGLSGERGANLPASSRVVARCGDLEMMITGAPGARLDSKQGDLTFVPEKPTSIDEAACKCGSEQCDTKHHITAWKPHANPHVALTDFVWNAVKGPMARVGADVIKLRAKNFKQGMYYSLLAAGKSGAPNPIRHADVRLFYCPECQKLEEITYRGKRSKPRREELASKYVHAADCDKTALRMTHADQLIEFDRNRYALRAYVGANDDLKAFPWYKHLDAILHRQWAALDPLERDKWWNNLGLSNDLTEDMKEGVELACAYFEPRPGNWNSLEASKKLRWLARAANHSQECKELSISLMDWMGCQPSERRPSEESLWAYVELIASSRPSHFLLIKGPPPGVLSPPTRTVGQQSALLQKLVRRTCVQRPKHYWSKEG